MSDSNRDNYWAGRAPASRRTVLRGAATLGVGLAGAFALACGGSKTESSGGGAKPAANNAVVAPAGTAPQSLIGRVGTNPTTSGEQPVLGGTFNTTLNGNPPTLDPHLNVSVNTLNMVSPVLSRLWKFKSAWDIEEGNQKNVVPDLALTSESPDAQTWTFKLRPDAKYQNIAPLNGRLFDAEDVKATFTKALDPKSANRGQLSMIEPAKIEMPDKNTVVFKLNYPYAPFQRLLCSGVYSWIMPREAVAGAYDPAKKVVGTGPFTMESFTPDVGLMFKKNPEYFEKGKPYVDAVKVAIVPDQAQRMAQFTAGNLDYLSITTIEDVPTVVKDNPKAEVLKNWAPGDAHMYYALGDKSAVFQDIRVRQAASMAVDRKAFGKALLGDQYIIGFNVGQQMGKWALRLDDIPADAKPFYEYDLQKAKQLMEAAGGSKIDVKMIFPVGSPPGAFLQPASELIYNMMKALPWQVTYIPVDYNKDWIAGGKGYGYGAMKPDMMAWWGLSSRTDIDEYMHSFWHSKGAGNISQFNDPKYDAMIDKARTIVNDDERLKAYKEVQLYLATNQISLTGNPNGLTYQFTNARVRNYLQGDPHGVGSSFWGNLWLKA